MKLVQYTDQKLVTLSPSTHKDGLDLKLDDKIILSIVPEAYTGVKVILPSDSTIKVYKDKLENELL